MQWGLVIDGSRISIYRGSVGTIIAAVPLWFLISMRDRSVGVDAGGTHFQIYNYIINGNLLNSRISTDEVGYVMLNRVLLSISNSYHIILLVTGTVTFLLFYLYILRESEKPSLSILIYFLGFYYFHQYNVIRQYLAIAILLIGIKFIYQRKLVNYLVVVAIASVFHYSALIFLPVYFLYNLRINLKTIIAGIIGSRLFFWLVWGNVGRLFGGSRYARIFVSSAAFAYGYTWADMITSVVLLSIGYIIFCNMEEYDPKLNR